MNQSGLLNKFRAELNSVDDLDWLDSHEEIERFSRDFYDYSPVLKEQLKSCFAELIVRPHSLDAVIAVASACSRNQIPLTIRGSGTGNYGQCVPLQGGVVMLMGSLNKVRAFDETTGEVTVETGCLLADLDRQLALYGRQLRLVPSTWRSASVGGFLAGGSGGIGSIRWGFLRDPGHLLALEIVTLEDRPRKLKLNGTQSEALNHAYGTNGIITALTISTAPLVTWHQVAIDCDDWSQGVELLKQISRAAIALHLGTFLEAKILENLPTWSGPCKGKHRLLLLVAQDGVETIIRLSRKVGLCVNLLGAEDSKSSKGLRELSWNHTTLHMRSIDPEWTYLQMLLPEPEIVIINELNNVWKDNILWHLESVRNQGEQRLAALPLVRWKGLNSLEKLMDQCKELGVILFNPHVITVEDGGLGVIDGDQVNAKLRYDPSGILNPGKLKGWDLN